MKNEPSTIGKGIRYKIDHKHFWAAFLNLARHNVFIVINHINQQLSLNQIENDQDILRVKSLWSFSNRTSLDKKEKLYNLINKHFPFLLPASYGLQSYEVYKKLEEINGKKKLKNKEEKQIEQSNALSPESLNQLLFDFLEKLQNLRNYYSHFKHSKNGEIPKLDNNLINRLYEIFDANVRMVKQDHKHNINVNPHNDFEHLIRKRKNDKNPLFKSEFNKGDDFSESGLLFFTSLFLEKKDAIWMQKKIFGFKGGDESYKQMTNEVFCRSRILLPKLRLESKYDEDQLVLDMLGELARCPKSLFERLKEKDR